MRIEVIKNKVVCSLEDKNHDFLRDCYGYWDGFFGYGYLKMKYAELPSKEWTVRENFKTIKYILFAAEQYGVEVDEEVTKFSDEWRQQIEDWDKAERERTAKYRAMERWDFLKKNGCGRCANCRRTCFEDDFICGASGDTLPVNDIGAIGEYAEAGKRRGVNALTCLAPFPSDNCPFKADELDKNNKDYLDWKAEGDVIF